MRKKRILVTISFSFSIRYLYRSGLLHKLRDFAEPVIALTWYQEDLVEELKREGFEVHLLPESRWAKEYQDVRNKIDIWFNKFQSKTPSKAIQKKYLKQFTPFKTRLLKSARERYNSLLYALPGQATKLFEREKMLLRSATNYAEMSMLVGELDIDAVFTVTPFHKQEDVLLQVCKNEGKQMLTSILSFDNVTKRGWLPVEYDVYMLWNKYNETQLKRIYPLLKPTAKVVVTGAVQFDFYFNPDFLQTKQEWSQQAGITNKASKIILYSGGPEALLPQETMFLKDIDEAITNGDIKGKPVVLFRCHPMDKIERWKLAVGPSKNIIYETSWTGAEKLQNSNISRDDIVKLCSTLAYTDVHVNVSSTMTVDGSAFAKPQIGPAYDKDASKSHLLQGMYMQEHFMPIMKSGGLKQATTKQELIVFINEALAHPQHSNKVSNDILKEIITYTDGGCTDRVADVLREALMPATVKVPA